METRKRSLRFTLRYGVSSSFMTTLIGVKPLRRIAQRSWSAVGGVSPRVNQTWAVAVLRSVSIRSTPVNLTSESSTLDTQPGQARP